MGEQLGPLRRADDKLADVAHLKSYMAQVKTISKQVGLDLVQASTHPVIAHSLDDLRNVEE